MTLTNENDEDRQNIILNRSASTLSSEAQISSSRSYHQNQTVGWPNNNFTQQISGLIFHNFYIWITKEYSQIDVLI